MVESQKVQKLQSSLLVFLSKQSRKENILDGSKELVNQEKIIKCLVSSKTFLEKDSWDFRKPGNLI